VGSGIKTWGKVGEKMQEKIARLLNCSRQEAEKFIKRLNSELPERTSLKQIAYVLDKLPPERRTFSEVFTALGGTPQTSKRRVETAPTESPDEVIKPPRVPVAARKVESIKPTLKVNWRDFEAILKANNIRTLYHFTDASNIPSIKQHGGLYSWYYCQTHGLGINCPGGNDLSRSLDLRRGLEDYVRLNFNSKPPMRYAAKHIDTPVVLEVDLSVIYWATTKFSDINATDNMATIGDDLATFLLIDFGVATALEWMGELQKKLRQAEVMVKTHIPLSFIRFPGGF
jgi:hypothetical protein